MVLQVISHHLLYQLLSQLFINRKSPPYSHTNKITPSPTLSLIILIHKLHTYFKQVSHILWPHNVKLLLKVSNFWSKHQNWNIKHLKIVKSCWCDKIKSYQTLAKEYFSTACRIPVGDSKRKITTLLTNLIVNIVTADIEWN